MGDILFIYKEQVSAKNIWVKKTHMGYRLRVESLRPDNNNKKTDPKKSSLKEILRSWAHLKAVKK